MKLSSEQLFSIIFLSPECEDFHYAIYNHKVSMENIYYDLVDMQSIPKYSNNKIAW